jgi:hypothetical protein
VQVRLQALRARTSGMETVEETVGHDAYILVSDVRDPRLTGGCHATCPGGRVQMVKSTYDVGG